MNHTQPAPPCPQCGRPVYRTHTCRASGLLLGLNGKLPERGEQLPAAPPLRLFSMPEGWKANALAGLHPVPDYDDVPDAYWPPRAQLHLVEEPDLDWGQE